MNIAIITNYYPDEIGGAEMALHSLARQWDQLGHRVVLFAARGSGRVPRWHWRPRYRHVVLRRPVSTRIGLGSYARKVLKEHRRDRFDVLLASDCYWAGHVAKLVWQRSKLPFVIWSHGSDLIIPRFLERPICRRRMEEALAHTCALTVVSEHLRGLVAQHFGRLQRPVHVIGNGWPDDWALAPPPPRPLRARYVFAIGRIVEQKGFHVLVAAYRQLSQRHPDVALVVAGDGPYRQQLIAKIDAAGLPLLQATWASELAPPCVVLTGAADRDTKWALLSHAEVLVCPSLEFETHGIVIQEAFACGTPVIGTRLGAIPELIRDGENGMLVRPGDVDSLATKLDAVLGCPGLRADLAAHTRSTVADSCWSKVAERHLKVLQAAAGRDGHG